MQMELGDSQLSQAQRLNQREQLPHQPLKLTKQYIISRFSIQKKHRLGWVISSFVSFCWLLCSCGRLSTNCYDLQDESHMTDNQTSTTAWLANLLTIVANYNIICILFSSQIYFNPILFLIPIITLLLLKQYLVLQQWVLLLHCSVLHCSDVRLASCVV